MSTESVPDPSTAIPASTAPFFQEYDFTHLDVSQHAELIIERILAYGNRVELRWLVQTSGWEKIRAWIAETGNRRLPLIRYNLWCLVFDVPQEEQRKGIWKR